MHGREELEYHIITDEDLYQEEVYLKNQADKVMDAMEARIKELEYTVATLNRKYEYELSKATEWGNDLMFAKARIKELEKHLEDVQNTMATENVDLGMENFKLQERVKELESIPHTDNTAVIEALQRDKDDLIALNEKRIVQIKELESQLPKWKVLENLVPKNKYLKFLSIKNDGKLKVNVGFVREGIFGVDVVFLEGNSVVSKCFKELKGKIFYLEETLPPPPTTEKE